MFDLEERIADWRKAMAAALGDKADVIDELESHLREELHRLALAGRPAAEAWDIAVERLGPPQRVAEEFGKLESAGPLRWIAAWVVFGVYASTGIGLIVMALPVLWQGGDLEILLTFHVLSVFMGYCAVLAFGALAICSFGFRLIRGPDEQAISRLQWWGQRFSWAGLLLTAIGVVTGAFWANASWGSFWNWDARELGGAAVIGWHAFVLWRMSRSGSSGASAWVLGVTGNMVVWGAWFGPFLFETGLHGYGRTASLASTFGIFMGIHALFLAIVVSKSRAVRPALPSR
jgi:hypothetical protein